MIINTFAILISSLFTFLSYLVILKFFWAKAFTTSQTFITLGLIATLIGILCSLYRLNMRIFYLPFWFLGILVLTCGLWLKIGWPSIVFSSIITVAAILLVVPAKDDIINDV